MIFSKFSIVKRLISLLVCNVISLYAMECKISAISLKFLPVYEHLIISIRVAWS